MEWLLNNWMALFGGIIILAIIVLSTVEFYRKPKDEQIENLKSWLLYAVVEAEKWFGSKMGVMKLRYVYDMFLGKFPSLANYITFELFSVFVDEALEKIKPLIESNTKLSDYIEE